MMGNDTMPNMMPMYFTFSHHLSHLLFRSWSLNNPGELVGAIIVVMVFAILYELLKTVRELLMYFDLKRIDKKMRILRRISSSSSRENLVTDDRAQKFSFSTSRYESAWVEMRRNLFKQYINPIHLVQSALHVVQVGMGYLLMLVAMTFNGWLFLAVCFGAGLGYLIFGRCRQSFSTASLSSREQYEHCH